MNYADYKEHVALFMERKDLAFFFSDPKYGDCIEPHFSKYPCDCCGSTLGGNRTKYVGVTSTYERYDFTICDNCVYYNEYGRLDDTTMLEIKDDPGFVVG